MLRDHLVSVSLGEAEEGEVLEDKVMDLTWEEDRQVIMKAQILQITTTAKATTTRMLMQVLKDVSQRQQTSGYALLHFCFASPSSAVRLVKVGHHAIASVVNQHRKEALPGFARVYQARKKTKRKLAPTTMQ